MCAISSDRMNGVCMLYELYRFQLGQRLHCCPAHITVTVFESVNKLGDKPGCVHCEFYLRELGQHPDQRKLHVVISFIESGKKSRCIVHKPLWLQLQEHLYRCFAHPFV
mmetsp:Transcript_12334/g.31213  ORF Transcript_12334/g.31213 Transcript_12334/m.31213 type:complete len:109 (+) Transcript_12334:829-1155(+)